MTTPEPTATRRMVWYTIANAIGDSTLPEPSHLSFHPGERSIVSMTFDRLDSAERWARFLGWRPDDPVEITTRPDQSVTLFAEKRGWRWHLHYHPIAAVAGALLDADGADERSPKRSPTSRSTRAAAQTSPAMRSRPCWPATSPSD